MHNYVPSVIILLVISMVGIRSAVYNLEISPFKKRRTTFDRIAEHGYPVEHHQVVTEDGYILGVFRIPYSHKLQNQNKTRPIVLIQHGLMGGSDAWIYVGPDHALPYMLADFGFDVWLGNGRGNTYSKKHNSLCPENSQFWKFSWHEIGYYDIAAMIDYALDINGQGQKSLHYVGHSQGTTVFFTLMSLRPEYNAKIKTAHMFAPVAFMTHMRNKLVRLIAILLGHNNIFSYMFSEHEFLPFNDLILSGVSKLCEDSYRSVCRSIVKFYYSSNNRWNKTALLDGIGVQPAGCSTNQILHYLQEQQSGHFRQFDYGAEKNLKMYSSPEPPDYPLQDITAEVHLWYSDKDVMAEPIDVLALAKSLPNKKIHHIADPDWTHDDFALSLDLRKYINEPVIEILKKYENASKLKINNSMS